MSTHDSALPVGHRLDEYLIAKLLGHGGFGLTYLAQDTNLNAFVAIKEFLPSEFAVRGPNSRVMPRMETDQDSYRWGLDRFKEEARALARFKHPNIVRAARLLEANGTAYMVMDYAPGMTLGQFLKRYAPVLDEARLLGVFLPVLDGLEALHAEGLVHRDIKPGNIYLRAKGGPMLIDFGAVRQAIGAQTRSLTTLVTPGYAPIEQYSMDGRQGAWTDLYATGATMYYCMFGHAPADATRRSAAMSDDTQDPYLSAHTKNQGRYSSELVEAVDWALNFKARDRPQAAHELRERLHRTPVTPISIELPDAALEMPALQAGVFTNQDSQPGAANTLDPLFVLPDSDARPRTALDGAQTRPAGELPFSTPPTQLRTDRMPPQSAETATQVLRPSPLTRLRVYIDSRRNRLKALLGNPDPVTVVSPDNTRPVPLTMSYWLEHKRLGLGISAAVVLLLLAAIILIARRPSEDQRLFDAAVSENTPAAYELYLQACARCARKADAEAAMTRAAKLEKLNGMKKQFQALLARGALTAPANPNAGSVLHDITLYAATDPELPALRRALDAAEKHQAQLAAERAKPKTPKPQTRLAQARSQAQNPAPASTLPDSGEPLAQPVNPLHAKYPQSARAYGKAGWVEVDFMVQTDGSISDVQVVAAQPKAIFDQAALQALYSTQFKPYLDGGEPARKRMRLRIDFRP